MPVFRITITSSAGDRYEFIERASRAGTAIDRAFTRAAQRSGQIRTDLALHRNRPSATQPVSISVARLTRQEQIDWENGVKRSREGQVV